MSVEQKAIPFNTLKEEIVSKMAEGGDGIKSCTLVDRALYLADVFLPRSPQAPQDGLDQIEKLEADIVFRHSEICPDPMPHSEAYITTLNILNSK